MKYFQISVDGVCHVRILPNFKFFENFCFDLDFQVADDGIPEVPAGPLREFGLILSE